MILHKIYSLAPNMQAPRAISDVLIATIVRWKTKPNRLNKLYRNANGRMRCRYVGRGWPRRCGSHQPTAETTINNNKIITDERENFPFGSSATPATHLDRCIDLTPTTMANQILSLRFGYHCLRFSFWSHSLLARCFSLNYELWN